MDIILAGIDLNPEEVHRLQQEIIGAAKQKHVCLWIECAGGLVEPGFACYDTARNVLGDRLIAKAVGNVASMGVIIFLAATDRMIGKETTIYLHPITEQFSGLQDLTCRDLRQMLKRITALEKRYAAIVAERTNLSQRQVLNLMARDTTLNAKQAVEMGFAQKIF